MEADPGASYRVRDLAFNRGNVKLFLTEGTLSFLRPVQGHVVGAIFTTDGTDGGDGEILALPPLRSERRSLAAATGSPNLDEHIRSAVFFFSDRTFDEFRRYQESAQLLPVSVTQALSERYRATLAALGDSVSQRLIARLLSDEPTLTSGFFFAALSGKTIGPFTFVHDPGGVEPVTFGRNRPITSQPEADQDPAGIERGRFNLWAAYTPRDTAPYIPPANAFSAYEIAATVRPNLVLDASAKFRYISSEPRGRAITLDLSPQLHVSAASIDGESVEVYQPGESPTFLLVTPRALLSGAHSIEVQYQGSIVRKMHGDQYLVMARTDWFPSGPGLNSTFDLTLKCPANLQLVATGEPVSEQVIDGQRVVRRRLTSPRPLAGFNLGRYTLETFVSEPYRIEVAHSSGADGAVSLLESEAKQILRAYTVAWGVVPARTLTISPISGSFGQGFPGLVYLSTNAYLEPNQRPRSLQGPAYDFFFSQLLLPHEIAHQWWGNLTTSASYQSAWFPEAIATYAALQYLSVRQPKVLLSSVLDQYRDHLQSIGPETQERIEQAGPLAWGTRLLNSSGPEVWQTIVYEKGAWVLHMLNRRLGEERFRDFERAILTDFASRPFTNEDLRRTAARFLPPHEPGYKDPELRHFFQTWVYETGLPRLRLRSEGREWLLDVNDVESGFTMDLPLRCRVGNRDVVVAVQAAAGENSLPSELLGARSCSLPSPQDLLYRR